MKYYYTSNIPPTLAWKLSDKGMHIKIEGHSIWCPIYAEVFDWLMERGIIIILNPCYNVTEDKVVGWVASVNLDNKVLGDDFTFGFNYEDNLTWHDAANAAIEKALTLI